MSPTESVVAFVRELEYKDIPANVIEDSKRHILDGLGVIFPASLEKNSQSLLSLMTEIGSKSESTVLSFGRKLSRNAAALTNGMMMGTTLDFDDLHVAAGLHPTTIVFPAVLAVAEALGMTGKDLLTAFVAGAEVAIRLGLTAPGRYHKRGFQPTSIIGTLAAALAVGKLLDFSEEKLTDSLGLATNLTSASPLSVSVGSYFQGVDTGRACESGILAAELAQKGFRTIRKDVLENQFGFLNTFAGSGNCSTDSLTKDLGKNWNIPKTFIKRYATTYAFTRYLDMCLELQRESGVEYDRIREVTYGVNSFQGPLFTEPHELKILPPDRNEARTSQFYSMAAAFVDGKITLDTFNQERIGDPRILQLAKKIHPVNDEEHFWVEVQLADGESLRAERSDLRQSSEKELLDKFRDNARRVIGENQTEEAIAKTLVLETAEDLGPWLELFVRAA